MNFGVISETTCMYKKLNHLLQSCIEIEDYAFTHFDHITIFEAQYR